MEPHRVDEQIRRIQEWYKLIEFLYYSEAECDTIATEIPTDRELAENNGGKAVARFRERKGNDRDLYLVESIDTKKHLLWQIERYELRKDLDKTPVDNTIIDADEWRYVDKRHFRKARRWPARRQWSEIVRPLIEHDFSQDYDENPFVPIVYGVPNYYHIRNAGEVIGDGELLKAILLNEHVERQKSTVARPADLPEIKGAYVDISGPDKEKWSEGLAKYTLEAKVEIVLSEIKPLKEKGISWSDKEAAMLIGESQKQFSKYKRMLDG